MLLKAGRWSAQCGFGTVSLWCQQQRMLVLRQTHGAGWTGWVGTVDAGWKNAAESRGHNTEHRVLCKLYDFAAVFGVSEIRGLDDPRRTEQPAPAVPASAPGTAVSLATEHRRRCTAIDLGWLHSLDGLTDLCEMKGALTTALDALKSVQDQEICFTMTDIMKEQGVDCQAELKAHIDALKDMVLRLDTLIRSLEIRVGV
jgi:hypothetical protein